MPALGSVGIGSGVLTSDILEKLKDSEKTTQINPIDKNIATNTQKTEALDLLKSLASTLQTSTSELKDSSMYQKRSVEGANDDILVTASDGVGIQDFSITDVEIAQKNVIQSGSFSSSDSKVATGDGTLNINIDGTDYEIDYDSNTSYDDLKSKINDLAGDDVTASILQTGDEAFSLIVSADTTGKDQQITLTDFDAKLDSSLISNNIQSGEFSASNSKIATGSGTFSLSVGQDSFNIDYNDTTTLSQLADLINADAGASSKVYATVVKNEYDNSTTDDDKYSLVLTAKDGSSSEPINIIDQDNLLNTSIVTDNIKSGNFDAVDSTIATASGKLSLTIGDSNVDFDYDDTTTLTQLADMINNDATASQDVYANIIEDSNGKFNLVVSAKDTSQNKQMGIVDYSGNLNAELKSDTLKSSDVATTTESIATGASADDQFSLDIGSDSYTFNYSNTTSLEDLVTMINGDAGASSKVDASIVQNPSGNYNLLLTAKEGSEDLSMGITDTSANLDISFASDSGDTTSHSGSVVSDNNGEMVDIQSAKDASFKYNGISMTRSSNTVDDIKLGLEIKLLKDDASANISITQDTQPIKDELSNFVDSYNSMQKQLDSMTLADVDAGKVGIFNADNSINSIGRSLRKLLTERDVVTGQALSHYGLEINRTGKLSFDSSKFDEKIKEDADGLAEYFGGKTIVDSTGLKDEINGREGTNILETGKFYSKNHSITSPGGTGKINIAMTDDSGDTVNYSFLYNNSTSLQDLADKINNDSESSAALDASIVKEGDMYKLRLEKKGTGDFDIAISDEPIEKDTHTDGIFEKLYNNLKGLNQLGGTILSMSDGLSKEGKTLEDNRAKSLTALNARYDTMTARFIQYDSMINQLNNQFASLQTQISMAVNGN